MDNKIVKVIFKEGWETMYSNDLTKCDYGQVLQIEGITLPEGNVEVHFSLTEHNGEAPISIGTVKDNVITVDIPDFILQKKDVYTDSYQAYAWIYVTDGESGRTIRKIVFTIDTRAEPSTNVPEDQKDKFLQEVRQVMAETKEVAQSVRDDADNGKFNGPQGDPGKDGKSAYQYAVEGGYTKTEEEFKESLARAGDVITKEEHQAELLKAFVKVTTDKSAFHHITDSANMKVVDFGMEGITEQDTVPGNQLFDLANSNGFVSRYAGLSTEIDVENNTLTTTNSHITDRTGHLDLGILQAGTYYISFEDVNNYSESIDVSYGELETSLTRITTVKNIGGSFTIEEELHCWLIKSIHIDNPLKLKNIMLNPGDTALPIEKYVGGMPSPNPEHEEEITLAGVLNEATGRYEHKCIVGNKNFFNNEWVLGFINTSTGEEQNSSTCLRSDYIKLPQQECIIGGLSNYLHYVFTYDDNKQFSRYLGMNATKVILSGNERYIRIAIYNSTVIPKSVQIEYGTTETDHVEHASQPFTLTSPRPITKWDKLVKRDGVWGWSVKHFNIICDGSENWNRYAAGKGFMLNSEGYGLTYCKQKLGFCNQLQLNVSIGSESPGLWIGMANTFIYCINIPFYDETLDDKGLANWKAHLNEHPLEVYTYKDESELVPLLDEEQELLRNLETYYGVTNVYNEQGCPMWFKYCADQELHWNQKLLQIQQAII